MLLEAEKSGAKDFSIIRALAGGTTVFEVRGDGELTLQKLDVQTYGATVHYGGMNVAHGGVTVGDGGFSVAQSTLSDTVASMTASFAGYDGTMLELYSSGSTTTAQKQNFMIISAGTSSSSETFSVRGDGKTTIADGGLYIGGGGATIIDGGLIIQKGGLDLKDKSGLNVSRGGLYVKNGGATITNRADNMTGLSITSYVDRANAAALSVRAVAAASTNFNIFEAIYDSNSPTPVPVFTITGEPKTVISEGGLKVEAGGMNVTAGGLDVAAGGATIQGGGLKVVNSGATITDDVVIEIGSLTVATGGITSTSAITTAGMVSSAVITTSGGIVSTAVITATQISTTSGLSSAGLDSTGVITTPGLDSTAVITTTTLEAVGIVKTAGLSSSAVVTVSGAIKATSFETTSDARLKQNITALSSERLRNLLSVQGVSFQWRREQFPERNFGNETMFGFLAQDVEKYFPEIVRRDADGWRRIQGGAFEPLLMEGIRFHDRRIAQLEEENRQLNDRLSQLEQEHTTLRLDAEAQKERDVARDAQITRLLEITRVFAHEPAAR